MPDRQNLPTRPLGRTEERVTLFALGGEGVLRTHGRTAEAVEVIQQALRVRPTGVTTQRLWAQHVRSAGNDGQQPLERTIAGSFAGNGERIVNRQVDAPFCEAFPLPFCVGHGSTISK